MFSKMDQRIRQMLQSAWACSCFSKENQASMLIPLHPKTLRVPRQIHFKTLSQTDRHITWTDFHRQTLQVRPYLASCSLFHSSICWRGSITSSSSSLLSNTGSSCCFMLCHFCTRDETFRALDERSDEPTLDVWNEVTTWYYQDIHTNLDVYKL